ncbi:MAG: exodeoxyribonuclease VII large subunit [Candidatus Omnitrophica bacterium]|nr:exodeoxyribonuclease VII large subunit [Candidatus Omnitrophota bacterium]
MPERTPDLFASAGGPAAGRHVYTVTEITAGIKEILEAGFANVWVEGEVSNFNTSGAGHWYFSLKDRLDGQEAILSAAIFNRATRDVKFKIENGLKVICFGSLNVYPPHGKYSLIVEKIEPKGIGSLQLALEQLKKKLEKQGLFAPEHKRPIPYLPARIGVVTSATGAAIKDILKVLDRRFRDTHIIVSPVRVQGDGAREDIASAINDFNRFNEGVGPSDRVEVLIVGRGGGSIEDLWAFNEEIVARAIYDSRIPVVSAVGHERDVTIADLVADVRAATPSVAAELVIPRKEDLREKIRDLCARLGQDFSDIVRAQANDLQDLVHRLRTSIVHGWELDAGRLSASVKKLELLNPAAVIPEYAARITDRARQIYVRMNHLVSLKDSQLRGTVEKLASLNPLNILARGYSVTFRSSDGTILKDAAAVKAGELLRTRLHKGEIISSVTEVRDNGRS